MKKVVVLVLALSLSLANISCKKSVKELEKAVANVNIDSSKDANAIIDFNNNFIDSYKNASNHIEGIVKYSNAAVIKAKGGDVLMMPMVMGIMDYSFSKIKGVPSGFGKDKKSIEADFKIYTEKKEAISKKYEELKSYISAEDFKDDKGAKAEAIQKEIEENAKAFFIAGENILAKIKPATDEAENIILKDHPLKDYILSSKSIMNSLDDIFGTIDKQYSGQFNEAELQKKYDEFEKAVNANSQMEFKVKDGQYSHKKTQFDNFNKQSTEFLGSFRKLIRDAKESGKITDGDLSIIESSYNSVLSSYNSFVK
ncbi:DUF3829 domain-containing protein [Chryseobacterium sp.]|uniref:DUF3829 domain-containing protein n=1 Tax=Chryseobacterium sp. TaxID=1871047 RepID=UPI0025BA76A8|nr:DUF3829 domain-containing protein [Chryseobacterium sp.]